MGFGLGHLDGVRARVGVRVRVRDGVRARDRVRVRPPGWPKAVKLLAP